jgi:DNA helicase-2/ATP-dependent DNA helicase PcrA
MLVQPVTPLVLDYGRVYENCNPAQREAIERTEGTVLVVAGPGTGKTQIIAARITNILRQGNQPETILCLTYTDAGTIAMRERLLSFIGTDAYRVNIHTFHAFCNMVIQDNPSHFGFSDLRPVSELERSEIVQEVLDSLPHDNPLAREKGDLYSDTKGLLSLYGTMKREDWKIETVIAAVDEYVAALPDRPDMRYARNYKGYRAGDLKQHLVDAETAKFERLAAAVRSFDDFQRLMREKRLYDFDDMILWVIDAFTTHPELLTEYQERYQYVLVDEYQDTSGSQNEVVDLLMSYWDDPNLFVVGDDDQSIYRFQGANIENILSFHHKYRPWPVTLTGNYRSTRQILAAATALIRENVERLANSDTASGLNITKELVAHRPDGEKPELRVYPTLFQEAIGIAREIEERHRRGEEMSRVAVLYRNHRQAGQVIRYLNARGVPFSTRRRENVLETPVIRHLLTILKYLAGEMQKPHGGERLLFRLMSHASLGLAPLEVARLYAPGSGGEGVPRPPVRERLRSAGFAALAELIDESIGEYGSHPLPEFVHRLLTRFGILSHVSRANDAVWQMTALNTFFSFIGEECAKAPRLSLARLVELVEIMEKRDIALPADRVVFDRCGVNFITTHSAKGLEFETVYLIGCNEAEWEGKRVPVSFAMPPNLLAHHPVHSNGNVEELRRLFYVAMTRAEKTLVISYADRTDADKQLAKSRFIAELERTETVVCNACQLETRELETAMQFCLREAPAPDGNLFTADFVGERLREYKLSVSHLNTYLKCPRTFFFETVLRVPEPKNAAMAFGTSVHKALEHLFKAMQHSPDHSFPPKEEFIARFEREMQRNQDAFTEVEFTRRLKGGMETLSSLYDRQTPVWHRDVVLEEHFQTMLDDSVPINGLVDKLELFGKTVNLVDYKTGRYDKKKFQPPDPDKVQKALNDRKEPKHEDLHGGDYWRQAVFYTLLVEQNHKHSYQVASTEFCYVEPDRASGDFVNHRVEITPEDVAIVREQIREVYGKIMNREFDGRCGSVHCEWCRE